MKKLLALVLALVMTLSLCVTSNAAYTDAADVDLNEAVDVLTAVGVFQGSDGKFDPKANLTREQAAKLVAYLQVGQKAADALVGGGKFADVAKDRWSAGYVDYCASIGIAAGVGDGKFDPAGQLTALQFGKMLLVEIGYDAKAAGMTGTDWTINTSKLMASANLLKGLSAVTANSVVTREQAAQMMLNALKAPMVEYENKSTSISVNGADIVFGGSKASYVTTTVAKEQTISDDTLTNSNAYTIELGEKLFTKLVLNDDATDDFNRPTHTWFLSSKKIGAYADAEDLTYTKTVSLGTIYSDLGLSIKGIAKADVAYYIDGVKTTFANDIVKGSTNEIGGNGALVQVWYTASSNTAIITVVNTYVAKVATVYAATSTKDAYVVLSGTTNTGIGGNYETDKFAVDDMVLYTYAAGEVQSMALAEKVTGSLTAYTEGKSVTVGGTAYSSNTVKKSKDTIDGSLSNAINTDVDVYLDEYGYAVYVDASAASDAYAVILGTNDNTGHGTGTLQNADKAELLFLDGTRKTVDVKELDGATYYDIVSYKMTSEGKYIFDLVASSNDDEAAGPLVTKGTALMGNEEHNLAAAGSSKANGRTIFMVYNESTKTISRYVGIANVANITLAGNNDSVSVFVKAGAPAAKVVFVALVGGDDTVSGNTKDVFYIKGVDSPALNHTEEFGDYYEYDAVINGEITKIKMTNSITQNTIATELSKDSKGVYTLVTGYFANASQTTGGTDTTLHYVKATAMAKNDAAVNGTITLGGNAISVSDKCVVYTISADKKTISASTINAIQEDANDEVWYKTTDGEVTYIFLQIVDDATVISPVVSTEVVVKGALTYTGTGVTFNYYRQAGEYTLTNTDIAAILSNDGCTDISVNGDGTFNFTKGGVKFVNQTVTGTQVYKLTLGTVTKTATDAAFLSATLDTTYVANATGLKTFTIKVTNTDTTTKALDVVAAFTPAATTVAANELEDVVNIGAAATTTNANFTISAIAADTVVNITLKDAD